MPKRLLLFNTDLLTGGAERQLVHLAQHLDRSRWDVSILLLEGTGPFLQDVPSDVTVHSLSKGYPRSKPSKILWSLRQLVATRRFFRENSFDVVLTFLWIPTLLCALSLPKGRAKPRLVWSVQTDLSAELSPIERQLADRIIPRRVEHFIGVSNGISDSIHKRYPALNGRVSLIHNAISLQTIEQRAAEESPYPKPKGVLRMITVGRIHRAKAFPELIDAIARVAGRLQEPFELLIMGDGEGKGELEELIRLHSLKKQVKLMGFTANPYSWLRSADMFIMSSRWETFGIALAEAMALGLPVIATETSGARDLIENESQGLTVPVGDVDALSKAIFKLATTPFLREALGREARRRAMSFDVSAIVPKYECVLGRVSC